MLNHLARWSDEPCVQDSLSIVPGRLLLDPVVADRLALEPFDGLPCVCTRSVDRRQHVQQLPARLLDNAGLQLQPITLKEERAPHGQRGILGKPLPSCRQGRDTWNSSNSANNPAAI